MATKKFLEPKNRYCDEHRDKISTLKDKLVERSEVMFGLKEISRSCRGFLGRKNVEYMIGKLVGGEALVEENGKHVYTARLVWFGCTKDKDGDTRLCVKIIVTRTETETVRGKTREVIHNDYPTHYAVTWGDNLIELLGSVIDEMDMALSNAERQDYVKNK